MKPNGGAGTCRRAFKRHYLPDLLRCHALLASNELWENPTSSISPMEKPTEPDVGWR